MQLELQKLLVRTQVQPCRPVAGVATRKRNESEIVNGLRPGGWTGLRPGRVDAGFAAGRVDAGFAAGRVDGLARGRLRRFRARGLRRGKGRTGFGRLRERLREAVRARPVQAASTRTAGK